MKKLILIFTLLFSTVMFSSTSYSKSSFEGRYPLIDTCPNSPSKKISIVGKWSNCIGTYILKDRSTLQGPFSSGRLNGNFFFTTAKGLVGLQKFENSKKVGAPKLLGSAKFLAQKAPKKTTSQKNSDAFEKGFDAYMKNNYATVLREWKPLAKQGDSRVQNYLGWMYEKGHGVPQNYRTAMKWYRLAAKQGHDVAQSNLDKLSERIAQLEEDKKPKNKKPKTWSPRGNFGIKFGMTYKDVVQQTEHVKGCSKSAYSVDKVIGNFRDISCSLTSRHGNLKINLLVNSKQLSSLTVTDSKVDPSSKVVGLARSLDSFNFSSWAKYHNILKKKYKLIKEYTRVDQEKFSRNEGLIINSYQNNRLKERPKYIQLIGRNRWVATNGFVYEGDVSVYYYSISAGKKIMQKYNRNKKLDDDL